MFKVWKKLEKKIPVDPLPIQRLAKFCEKEKHIGICLLSVISKSYGFGVVLGTQHIVKIKVKKCDLNYMVPGEILSFYVNKIVPKTDQENFDLLSGEISLGVINAKLLNLKPLKIFQRSEWTYQNKSGVYLAPKEIGAPNYKIFEFEHLTIDIDMTFQKAIKTHLEKLPLADNQLPQIICEDLVAFDLRYIDAHVQLGNLAFNSPIENAAWKAKKHFEVAVQVGELSIQNFSPERWQGVFAYNKPSNQPFFRALFGLAMAQWRLGYAQDAKSCFEKLSSLDPSDPLDTKECVSALEQKAFWNQVAEESIPQVSPILH